jgi:hypothetical protein
MNSFYNFHFSGKNKFISAAVLFILSFLSVGIFAQSELQSFQGGPGACGSNNSISKNTPPSPLDGSGSLWQIYNNSACGLNYTDAI